MEPDETAVQEEFFLTLEEVAACWAQAEAKLEIEGSSYEKAMMPDATIRKFFADMCVSHVVNKAMCIEMELQAEVDRLHA